MKTSNFFRRNGARLSLLAMLVGMSLSCENSTNTPDVVNESDQRIEINTDDAEIEKNAKIVTSILTDVGKDENFTALKSESEQFDFIKNLLAKKYNIKTDFSYQDLQDIKASVLTIDGTPLPESRTARTSADPMAGFSAGEKQFVEYATQYTQAAADISQFNTRVSELRTGLRTNHFYPYLNYNSPGMDRLYMLDDWLTNYSQYANQWPDDLDTFNPFPAARESSEARVAGSCKGFWKKLCIAKWTALFAIAGAAASGPGGGFLGGAAGFWVGRCCKCGCTCDVVVCDI